MSKYHIFKPEEVEDAASMYECPEDSLYDVDYTSFKDGVKWANAKLQAYMEAQPKVEGRLSVRSDGTINDEIFERVDMPYVTHTAVLAFIEPLAKEPCKHEPAFSSSRVSAMMHNFDDDSEFYKGVHCAKCGVELIADWKAK